MSSSNTGIEWTDKTWNPTTGCNKVSPGCLHCYAEALTARFPKTFPNGFELTLHPERLDQPRKWKTPSRIFVNSMSDLFHQDVPLEYLKKVFAVMRETPWHVYQVLTKREQRLEELAPLLEWSENIWVGVSVESQKYTCRVDSLRRVPAKVRFLSCEPLLGPLELDLDGIDWVIVGGESGSQCRTLNPDWVRDILLQTHESNSAFFFKQWGGYHAKAGGRVIDGRTWSELPHAWLEHVEQWQQVKHVNRQISNKLEEKSLVSSK